MSLKLVKEVKLCEVGLRDGIQNEKKYPSTREKIDLINKVTEAGFPVIEVGSFVSPKAVPQMADTDKVFREIIQKEGVEYRALVANIKGVERAINCGCKKVKLNVSASVSHNLANLHCTPSETVAKFTECVKLAKEANIGVSGSISMAFGSPWEGNIDIQEIKKIIEAYKAVGVYEISLSDASGMAHPIQVYNMCMEMQKNYSDISWWLHFHNTRGLGIVNIFAGMQAGFNKFDCSLAGIGGCPFVPGASGNVTTEDLINMCIESGIETGIDIDKVILISRAIVEIIGHNTDSYILRAGKSSDLLSKFSKIKI